VQTCYVLVVYVGDFLWTCDGEVASCLLQTCYVRGNDNWCNGFWPLGDAHLSLLYVNWLIVALILLTKENALMIVCITEYNNTSGFHAAVFNTKD